MDSHGISQPGSSFCNPRTRRATWCALDAEGCLGLLVTGLGRFRARLTHVTLHGLRIAATEEQLARTSLVAIPPDMLLVSLPQTNGSAAIWGGIRIGAGEFMTLGPGQRAHTRTDRSCRWASIWLPAAELVCYGSAFAVPSAVLAGRPWPAMGRHLRHLHSAAIRLVERGSNALIDEEAAHGLEQLGVSAQTLRASCEDQLGMGPAEYVHRGRMQLVHGALRHEAPKYGDNIGRRAELWVPQPWAVCRRLSRSLRRAAVCYPAGPSGRGAPRITPPAC